MRTVSGFTLIEMLVSLLLVGIIADALFAFQGVSTRSFNQTFNAAQSMQDMQDASNYLSDRVRAAEQISTSLSLNTTAGAINCSTAIVSSTCFAVLVPDTSPLATTPYLTLVYQVIPRSGLTANDKTIDPWADTAANNVYALQEYRLPTSSTSLTPVVDVSTVTPNVILDHLSLDFSSSTTPTTPFFTYDATAKKTTFNLQLKQQQQSSVQYTPATGPISLIVYPKNLS